MKVAILLQKVSLPSESSSHFLSLLGKAGIIGE